jgi:hypothetical protein
LVDRQGKGLAGITVRAEANDHEPGSGEAKTVKDGSYAINSLLPGRYHVRAVGLKDTVALPIADILVKAGEAAKAPKMIVTPGVLLRVRVVDADSGKPITRGWVTSYLRALSRATYKTSNVDGLGRCDFRALPGDYQMYFRGESAPYKYMPTSSVSVTVPKSGVKNLVLKVKKADIARGRVVDTSGKPLAGASVSVGAPWGSKTTTDASGRFTAIIPPAQKNSPG